MYACMSKLIAKTVLLFLIICASVKEHLGELTCLNMWRRLHTTHPLYTQRHMTLTLIMWELIF